MQKKKKVEEWHESKERTQTNKSNLLLFPFRSFHFRRNPLRILIVTACVSRSKQNIHFARMIEEIPIFKLFIPRRVDKFSGEIWEFSKKWFSIDSSHLFGALEWGGEGERWYEHMRTFSLPDFLNPFRIFFSLDQRDISIWVEKIVVFNVDIGRKKDQQLNALNQQVNTLNLIEDPSAQLRYVWLICGGGVDHNVNVCAFAAFFSPNWHHTKMKKSHNSHAQQMTIHTSRFYFAQSHCLCYLFRVVFVCHPGFFVVVVAIVTAVFVAYISWLFPLLFPFSATQ